MRGIIGGAIIALAFSGCVSGEDAFVGARLERLCGQAIPSCGLQASCALDEGGFVRDAFPGGLRVLVRSEGEGARLRVRLLLTAMSFPGTELQLVANTPDCAQLDEVHLSDVDLFAVAGDDRVFDWTLELPGRGDHLIELFSDMTAEYLLTIELIE